MVLKVYFIYVYVVKELIVLNYRYFKEEKLVVGMVLRCLKV